MAIVNSCCCDRCGADITKGDGRQWRLMLMSEVIGLKPGSVPHHDQGDVLRQQHFCDEKCLSAWASVTVSHKDELEARYQADLVARAAEEEQVNVILSKNPSILS